LPPAPDRTAEDPPHAQESGPHKSGKLWSKEVTEHDHPFELPPGLFGSNDLDAIAAALQRSAEDPRRGSDDAFRTAMSMLD